MRTLRSLAELDDHLAVLDRAEALTDEHLREAAASVCLEVDVADLPPDPTSAAYRTWQLALYEKVAGRPYTVANEATTFDFDAELREPFPYSTRSPRTVGDYLLSYGHLIRTLNLHAGLRVLEVGSGFGALTAHLATMAYRVTCIDISAELLAFVRQRTAHAPFPVRTVCGDMATVPLEGDDAGPYDAIIFYESFHHCLDHVALVDRLPALLAPEGRVVLAAEPIHSFPTPMVPYPWGLRLDGMSLRAIRRDGWLELGFTAPYISALFRQRGWNLRREQLGGHVLSDLWIAERRAADDPVEGELIFDEAATAHHFGTIIGSRDTDGGTLWVKDAEAGFLQFGPYFPARPGVYEAVWTGRTGGTTASSARFEVVTGQGQIDIANTTLTLPRPGADADEQVLAAVAFRLDEDRPDVEVRLFVDDGADVTLQRIRVERISD